MPTKEQSVFYQYYQREETMIQPVILEKLEELPEFLQTESHSGSTGNKSFPGFD